MAGPFSTLVPPVGDASGCSLAWWRVETVEQGDFVDWEWTSSSICCCSLAFGSSFSVQTHLTGVQEVQGISLKEKRVPSVAFLFWIPVVLLAF